MKKTSILFFATLLVGCMGNGSDESSSVSDSITSLINAKDGSQEEITKLKSDLESQQALIEDVLQEQQKLKEQLKRSKINIHINPDWNLNAGRSNQATASTIYVATLEDKSQFSEVRDLAIKEVSLIPGRSSDFNINLTDDINFIAINIDLRYTKKRSQFLIPLSHINFDEPLSINIGACDANISSGIDLSLNSEFSTKLKYYQQPLVSCQ